MDFAKNWIEAAFGYIKTVLGIDITFVILMLQIIKFINGKTKLNFRSGTLLETLLGLVSTIICEPNEKKQPLDLEINKNVITYDYIKSIFGIYGSTLKFETASELLYE